MVMLGRVLLNMIKLTVSILKFIGVFALCFLVLYLITATAVSFVVWESMFDISLWGELGRACFVLISIPVSMRALLIQVRVQLD